jgi:hypothetical protein
LTRQKNNVAVTEQVTSFSSPEPGARKRRKNILTINLKYLQFFRLIFPFAALTNTVSIFSSAAEPHHIDAAPAPCIHFDAAPTLVRILQYYTANILETNIS